MEVVLKWIYDLQYTSNTKLDSYFMRVDVLFKIFNAKMASDFVPILMQMFTARSFLRPEMELSFPYLKSIDELRENLGKL